MGPGWSEGNILVGYSRRDVFNRPMNVPLPNHKRIFSLSSLTSPTSLVRPQIEIANLETDEKPRFDKKYTFPYSAS